MKISIMSSRVQQLATNIGMTYDEFVGEMRKRGCSEPTASKIWNGSYLSNLRKAADVLSVKTGLLLPR